MNMTKPIPPDQQSGAASHTKPPPLPTLDWRWRVFAYGLEKLHGTAMALTAISADACSSTSPAR
jgi:hypothetical protein